MEKTENDNQIIVGREKIETKISEFDVMLQDVKSIDVRVKSLWTDIYRNAMLDRITAESLYTKLFILSHADDSKHITECAMLMTKYLERMHKSNEQLLQLAQQVFDATSVDVRDSVDAIYDQIGN